MSQRLKGIRQVVIWGYPKDTHTHSYIHGGYYKAFKNMGYTTYWFHKNVDVCNFDFSNTLFLTSGDVECDRIPLRKDCLYILHNCPQEIFSSLRDNVIATQVLVKRVPEIEGIIKINEYTYIEGNLIYQPWATDLLPEEIDINITLPKDTNIVNYVGTVYSSGYSDVSKDVEDFARGCVEDGISVHVYGGYTPAGNSRNVTNHPGFITDEQHVSLIRKSRYAPQFCGTWQKDTGYIPCRIFKNISYGHYGLTNSKYVNDIFEGELIFDEDGYTLYCKVRSQLPNLNTKGLMQIVKDKHTYINRVHNILNMFK